MVTKRDFTMLNEIISHDNVMEMAELLTIKCTKSLIAFMGYYAQKAHMAVYRDIIHKNERNYVLSENYDIVQCVAMFLCEHIGEHLDDFCFNSKKGKSYTIKMMCYKIINKTINSNYRYSKKHIDLESFENKIAYYDKIENENEQDYTKVDEIVKSLNLTENMATALNYRMSGLSYPQIANILERNVSTVYEYFIKMRLRYNKIYTH